MWFGNRDDRVARGALKWGRRGALFSLIGALAALLSVCTGIAIWILQAHADAQRRERNSPSDVTKALSLSTVDNRCEWPGSLSFGSRTFVPRSIDQLSEANPSLPSMCHNDAVLASLDAIDTVAGPLVRIQGGSDEPVQVKSVRIIRLRAEEIPPDYTVIMAGRGGGVEANPLFTVYASLGLGGDGILDSSGSGEIRAYGPSNGIDEPKSIADLSLTFRRGDVASIAVNVTADGCDCYFKVELRVEYKGKNISVPIKPAGSTSAFRVIGPPKKSQVTDIVPSLFTSPSGPLSTGSAFVAFPRSLPAGCPPPDGLLDDFYGKSIAQCRRRDDVSIDGRAATILLYAFGKEQLPVLIVGSRVYSYQFRSQDIDETLPGRVIRRTGGGYILKFSSKKRKSTASIDDVYIAFETRGPYMDDVRSPFESSDEPDDGRFLFDGTWVVPSVRLGSEATHYSATSVLSAVSDCVRSSCEQLNVLGRSDTESPGSRIASGLSGLQAPFEELKSCTGAPEHPHCIWHVYIRANRWSYSKLAGDLMVDLDLSNLQSIRVFNIAFEAAPDTSHASTTLPTPKSPPSTIAPASTTRATPSAGVSDCEATLFGRVAAIRRGEVSCDVATAVVSEYDAAEKAGSAAAAQMPSGWSCSTPSSGQRATIDYDTSCSHSDGQTFQVVLGASTSNVARTAST
jgi:hypothetical protein